MSARLTAQQRQLRTITETQFQGTVQQLMTATGWTWYHAPDNKPVRGRVQNVKAGFPDLVAVRGGRLIVAELKRETGKTSDAQDGWLEALGAAGAETYVWRPSDMDEVRSVLQITQR